MTSERCESTDKVAFSSKRAALNSLVGQLASKRVRVYPCPDHPSHFHLTKEPSKKQRTPPRAYRKRGKGLTDD